MDIKLNQIKLFSTEEEKNKIYQQSLEKDSKWGNPEHELQTMHNATKWGIYFFAAITLLSTAAFIYRVGITHVAELIGLSAGTAVMLVLAFGTSFAVEVMLRGVGEPFSKKLFVTKSFDVWLFFLCVIFTGTIVIGALTGMEIISDSEAQKPKIESALGQTETLNAALAANKTEIETLRNGKGKGVYAWKGKPTPHANKRIAELEKQNTDILATIQSVSGSTSQLNTTNIQIYSDKTAKAVRYLSRLAIGSEILKWIVFLFWGYRSAKLLEWDNGGAEMSEEKNTSSPLPQKNPNTPIPGGNAAAILDPAEEYRKARGFRATLRTRFKQNYNGTDKSYDLNELEDQWWANEDRLERACKALKKEYDYPEVPTTLG